ncbi:hypothetical protein QEG98_28155 [Myxococcus sp. MxC21-1]|uniref:hypothetical protein n=1 Tax=Myxococcus sp. MxC21-1 TaxID=3041439 RepID=UPI00292E03A6|nr:hypothetical protein [Myxococcus sp. MxC21-1]WNZ59879.1 hypothetical protein QEG98_28155 [Myxococcus sp. MxC21-1]
MKQKLKLLAVATVAMVLSGPAVALAQATGTPPASILDSLLTPTAIGTALGVLVGAVGLFGAGTWLTATRKRRIALAFHHAYNIVEDVAAEDPKENFADKAAKGLKLADDWLKANGWRPLKPHEQALAKMEFSAMHGAQKAEEKVRANAAAAALIASSKLNVEVVAAVP